MAALAGRRGFTLLELLVVIAILAALAGTTAVAYSRMGQHSGEQLVRAEMQQIAQALRQFRQDTGYYPREGVFKLTTQGGRVQPSELPVPTTCSASDRFDWIYSPANLYQLLTDVSPLPVGDPLRAWNPETGRGWRGPYLTGFRDGQVRISTSLNPTDPDQADTIGGNPAAAGDDTTVPAIADPFERAPTSSSLPAALLDWTDPALPAAEQPMVRGRPYLMLQTAAIPPRWELRSLGPDGDYNTNDDIILPLD